MNPADTPVPLSAAERLADCRRSIDDLDRKLLDLLNARTRVVEVIGMVKQEAAMAVYEPKREEEVFRNVLDHNQGPLTPEAVRRIFERIIDEMRTLQKKRMQA